MSQLDTYAAKRRFSRTPEPPSASSSIAAQERGSESAGRTGPAQADSGPSHGPLRFVVQKHAARRVHYDFRLEVDGVLKSWAVPKGPSFDPAEKRLAVLVEDHPLDYATFEGVIPKGEYGAGEVIVWDTGFYEPDEPRGVHFEDRAEAEAAMRRGVETGKISVRLDGHKLKGSWALVRMGSAPTGRAAPRERDGGKDWLLIKHQDEFADPSHDVLHDNRSVLSEVSVSDLRSGRPAGEPVRPEQEPGARRVPFPSATGGLAPMLPTLAEGPFSHSDWLFEPKLDGIRVLALVQSGVVSLVSRGGRNIASLYPGLAQELERSQEHELVLDGEIVALDKSGRPSFQRLQERINLTRPVDIRRADRAIPVVYYVFDLLYADGFDLGRVPLHRRKALLAGLLGAAENVRLVESFEQAGEDAYRAFLAYGLEGMIAKRRDSFYEPGRRVHTWLKVKGTLSDDFVVVGYTAGTGARAETFGALALGSYDPDGRLSFVGHVGTGFDDRTLAELRARLDRIPADECPFDEVPASNAPCHWVKPELVAEIKFSRWTEDGRLREPVFLRLREEKAAGEALRSELAPLPSQGGAVSHQQSAIRDRTAEGRLLAAGQAEVLQQLGEPRDSLVLEVEGHRLSSSHLDKVLWPGDEARPQVTKRDLIRYLARLSPYLLPHLKGRPLTIVRAPDGIAGERFYQKHIELGLPEFVETVRLFSEHGEGDGDYLMCNNLATLLWLGQMAALELHPWYSRTVPDPDGHHLGTEFDGSEAAIEASLLNYPDFVVFDLDPYIYAGREAPGEEPALNRAAYERTCQVAFWLKELLDQLGVASFVKTSGRTGLHIFVPILRQLDYGAARSACETIGRFLLRLHPKDVTMEWTTQKRTGKVFFDHNQNVRGKTLASIFSPRLAPEAAISMPLRWDELLDVYPTDFTVHTAAALVQARGDPWESILDAKQGLEALLAVSDQPSANQ